MAEIEIGHEYRVIGPGNLYKGKIIIVSEIKGGLVVAYVQNKPYPFLPGELQAIAPKPARPKRPTPSQRLRESNTVLREVLETWDEIPGPLKEKIERALNL